MYASFLSSRSFLFSKKKVKKWIITIKETIATKNITMGPESLLKISYKEFPKIVIKKANSVPTITKAQLISMFLSKIFFLLFISF